MWRKLWVAAFLFLAGSVCQAEVLVDKAWLRASIPGQTTASLQLTLATTQPGMLLKVETPMSEGVQIQQVRPHAGKVYTSVVPSLRLPRDRSVNFGEHGLALMLVGLKAPLSAGSRIPVTLTVRTFDGKLHKVETKAEVREQELSYKHYQKEGIYDH